jgi:hypothetical protein
MYMLQLLQMINVIKPFTYTQNCSFSSYAWTRASEQVLPGCWYPNWIKVGAMEPVLKKRDRPLYAEFQYPSVTVLEWSRVMVGVCLCNV